MKRSAVFLILGAAAVLALGAYGVVNWTALSTPKVPWTKLGTITAQNNDVDVSQRDYATLWAFADANTILWDVPDLVNAVELRFSTKADADAHVVEIWVAANDYTKEGVGDSFGLGASLALTGGKQPGLYSNYLVDTIVATEYLLTGSEVVDSAADRMAVWRVDLRGYKKVVIVATTLQASTTLVCEARWF